MTRRAAQAVAVLAALLLLNLSPAAQGSAASHPHQSKNAGLQRPPTANEATTDVFPDPGFDFGEIMAGTKVEHDFVIKNPGATPLLIQNIRMTPPLLVTQMPSALASGAEGTIHITLDSANLAGRFEGALWIVLDRPGPPAMLAVVGRITPSIEVSPMRAFFVAGRRGLGGRGAISIINHEPVPLVLHQKEHAEERFTTEVETLEPGQRYRLTLMLKPDGPAGRALDTIRIRTSSTLMPWLSVEANTYLYDRVHTFPEVLDFGTVRVADAGREALTLMVYREGGADFRVELGTDVPGVSVKSERGPSGDRYQATISLIGDKIRPGVLAGLVFIETNDAEFSKLTVPIRGIILP
jgi:hypothetical protein